MKAFEKIRKNKPFVITCSVVVILLVALNLVATQVALVSNTFNTLFGEERREIGRAHV